MNIHHIIRELPKSGTAEKQTDNEHNTHNDTHPVQKTWVRVSVQFDGPIMF